MKMPRKATTVGALMIAAGAITTGASITSQAMAAEDTTDEAPVSAVIIGAASVDGDAYQCVFDELELPSILPTEAIGSVPMEAPIDGAAGGASGDVVVDGELVAEPLPADATFSVSLDGGEGVLSVGGVLVEVAPGEQGSVLVDETGAVVLDGVAVGGASGEGVVPAETSGPLDVAEVRDGTAEECAALLNDAQATPSTPVGPAVESSETVAP